MYTHDFCKSYKMLGAIAILCLGLVYQLLFSVIGMPLKGSQQPLDPMQSYDWDGLELSMKKFKSVSRLNRVFRTIFYKFHAKFSRFHQILIIFVILFSGHLGPTLKMMTCRNAWRLNLGRRMSGRLLDTKTSQMF